MVHRMTMHVTLGFGALLIAMPALADKPGPGSEKAEVPMSGGQVYRTVCQSCHMADAKGATGAAAIPALANDPALAVPEYPITMIVKGRGAMPWFTDVLSPAQIAAVTGYIRTHFGNSYPEPVTVADVKKIDDKPAPKER